MVASVLVIVIANEELHRTITLSPPLKVITDIEVLPITCRVGGICITQRYILRQNQRIAFAVFGNLGCRQQGGRIIHIDLPSYHTAVALITCKRKEIGKLRSHRHVATSRVRELHSKVTGVHALDILIVVGTTILHACCRIGVVSHGIDEVFHMQRTVVWPKLEAIGH